MKFDSYYGVVVHRDFTPLYADDKYAQTFGYEKAEDIMALGSILDLIDPESQEIAAHTYYALMSGIEKPQVRSYINRNANGITMQVLAIEHIIEWQGRKALQITIVDLTESIKIRNALEASEQRYRELVDGSIQGVLVHRQFKPIFCNQAYANILGFAKTDSVLQLGSILEVIAPEYHDQRIQSNLQLTQQKSSSVKLEIQCIKQNGEPVWVQLIERSIMWEGEPASQVTLTDITEQYLLQQKLVHQAHYDELTQTFNRRAFTKHINQLLAESTPLTHYYCLLLDLDNFKKINDEYGHQVGDDILVQFASVCQQHLKQHDVIARWGGEEFIILKKAASLKAAADCAEQIRRHVAEIFIEQQSHPKMNVTVSIGVTALLKGSNALCLTRCISDADKALYKAKASGKNQVIIAR